MGKRYRMPHNLRIHFQSEYNLTERELWKEFQISNAPLPFIHLEGNDVKGFSVWEEECCKTQKFPGENIKKNIDFENMWWWYKINKFESLLKLPFSYLESYCPPLPRLYSVVQEAVRCSLWWIVFAPTHSANQISFIVIITDDKTMVLHGNLFRRRN